VYGSANKFDASFSDKSDGKFSLFRKVGPTSGNAAKKKLLMMGARVSRRTDDHKHCFFSTMQVDTRAPLGCHVCATWLRQNANLDIEQDFVSKRAVRRFRPDNARRADIVGHQEPKRCTS